MYSNQNSLALSYTSVIVEVSVGLGEITLQYAKYNTINETKKHDWKTNENDANESISTLIKGHGGSLVFFFFFSAQKCKFTSCIFFFFHAVRREKKSES